MANGTEERREDDAIRDLLRELQDLRELDARRHAHSPGTPAHEAASAEVDAQSKRMMDRFRDVSRERDADLRRA